AGRSAGREREDGGASRGKPGPTGERDEPRVAHIRAAEAERPAAGAGAVQKAEDLVAPVVDTLTEPVAGDGGAVAGAVRAVLG
ncbi:hypothetical protein, partial [Streptomyces sp. NPDC005890]|uniref:hypothetical protein n=1 Tax=Streptomyces sp. NPDC005890 TaxID=3154568 RepID=UPI0033D66B5D